MHPGQPLRQQGLSSPNHGERKDAQQAGHARPALHRHADAGEALQWLCNPLAQVSAHYFVFENGHVLQLVPEAAAPGMPALDWAGETDINSCSIGIEIANPGHPGGLPPFAHARRALIALNSRISANAGRSRPNASLAHSDIAPGRKMDPGERFPWERLPRAASATGSSRPRSATGVSLRAARAACRSRPCRRCSRMLGYGVRSTASSTRTLEAVVAAFQRHLRPERVDGVADASTITTLSDLIASRNERPRKHAGDLNTKRPTPPQSPHRSRGRS